MNSSISIKLAQILGEATLTDLPTTYGEPQDGALLFYENGARSEVVRGSSQRFYQYMCKHVFAFLFECYWIQRKQQVTIVIPQQQPDGSEKPISSRTLIIDMNKNAYEPGATIAVEMQSDERIIKIEFVTIDHPPPEEPEVKRRVTIAKVEKRGNKEEIVSRRTQDFGDLEKILLGSIEKIDKIEIATRGIGSDEISNPNVTDKLPVFRVHPERYTNKVDDTLLKVDELPEVIFGNYLKAAKPLWIAGYKGLEGSKQNITDVWFKHFQYRYLDNHSWSMRTMLIKYGPEGMNTTYEKGNRSYPCQGVIWPTRWFTNIPDEEQEDMKNKDDLYVVFPQMKEIGKALYIPTTALWDKAPADRQQSRNAFKRRDYTKIVNGSWRETSDPLWLDEDGVVEYNEDYVDDDGVKHENIGDIDQTLRAISDFLDDYMDIMKPTNHVGKVFFSTAQEPPVSVKQLDEKTATFLNVLDWDNSYNKSSKPQAMPHCGSRTDSNAKDDMLLPSSVPYHHHKTTPGNGTLFNVSIIGRPEGETVGGMAKVDTAEYLGEQTKIPGFAVIGDTNQAISKSSPMLSTSVGPYSGKVMYNNYEIKADALSHNNVPPFYKVRAFACEKVN